MWAYVPPLAQAQEVLMPHPPQLGPSGSPAPGMVNELPTVVQPGMDPMMPGFGLNPGIPTMPAMNVGPVGMESKSMGLGMNSKAPTMPAGMDPMVGGMIPPSMPPMTPLTPTTPMTPKTTSPIVELDQSKKADDSNPDQKLEPENVPEIMKPTPKATLTPRPPPTSPPDHLIYGPAVPAPAPLHGKVPIHVPPPKRPDQAWKDEMETVTIDDPEDEDEGGNAADGPTKKDYKPKAKCMPNNPCRETESFESLNVSKRSYSKTTSHQSWQHAGYVDEDETWGGWKPKKQRSWDDDGNSWWNKDSDWSSDSKGYP